ncbi:MAG: sodium:solute symporter family protein [Oscillospiraceae bacterium]|nr:sodium:solute symporter family protein [Oscillospiraceae bacterium]
MSVGTWMWIFVGAFLLYMFYLGYVGAKRAKDSDGWITARKSYSWWQVGLTICATYASGALFMGGAGMGYTSGYPVFWYSLFFPLGSFCGILLFGKITQSLHKQGIRTFGEYFGERYQSEFLRITMAVVSICLLFLVGAQIIAAGTVFSMMMGVPYEWAIWISTAIILIYIVGGGAHTDFLTDTAQGIVMIILAVVCIIISLTVPSGGPAAVNTLLEGINPEMGWNSWFNSANPQFSNLFFAGFIIFTTIPFAVQPHLSMKLLALKNPRDTKKAVMLALVVGFLFQINAGFTGLTAHAIVPEGVITRGDMALVAVLMTVFENVPVIAALLCSFIIAAVMSTVDGVFLAMAQVVSNDIYRKSIAPRKNHSPEITEKNCKKISRITTVLVGIIATCMVINPPPSLMQWLTLGSSCIFCCAAGPMILGALWKRTTKQAAVVSFLVTLVVYWILGLAVGLPGMTTPGVVFLLNMLLTWLISLATKPSFGADHLKKFGFSV